MTHRERPKHRRRIRQKALPSLWSVAQSLSIHKFSSYGCASRVSQCCVACCACSMISRMFLFGEAAYLHMKKLQLGFETSHVVGMSYQMTGWASWVKEMSGIAGEGRRTSERGGKGKIVNCMWGSTLRKEKCINGPSGREWVDGQAERLSWKV